MSFFIVQRSVKTPPLCVKNPVGKSCRSVNAAAFFAANKDSSQLVSWLVPWGKNGSKHGRFAYKIVSTKIADASTLAGVPCLGTSAAVISSPRSLVFFCPSKRAGLSQNFYFASSVLSVETSALSAAWFWDFAGSGQKFCRNQPLGNFWALISASKMGYCSPFFALRKVANVAFFNAGGLKKCSNP